MRSSGLSVLALLVAIPASAAESSVTQELVCAAQAAIRWRTPALTPTRCRAIAAALNATTAPMTMLGIAVNESDLTERAIAWHGRDVADVGLLGIRCRLGKHRRCTVGPAKGYTVAQLRDGPTNIRVGAELLQQKGSVAKWNAGSRGYANRIAVLVAALGGVAPTMQAKDKKERRVRELARRIAETVNRERRM